MIIKQKMRDKETLNTIVKLINEGIDKFAVIMRHSDRYFSTKASMEPFMGLTEKGKDYALSLGEALPLKPWPKFFSSYFGRCIETACIIDKGYSKRYGRFNGHNVLNADLSPFYIKNIENALKMVNETGSPEFLRRWFNREISEKTMENPEKTADTIADFLKIRLKELKRGEIAICVSHDWNLFPLKEYKLGLKHEDFGAVGFLESIIVFEDKGNYYITNYQKEPVILT